MSILEGIRDKKIRGELERNEKRIAQAKQQAKQAEMLLLEDQGYLEGEGLERTWKFKQSEIKHHLDLNTEKKLFDLSLDFGPYRMDYTRNGKFMLIGGRKGHVASFDWQAGKLLSELHVRETVRDVCWLQNETMYAAAQKKYTYIYDKTGLELHCLKDHIEANKLEFLPYHFLIASVGNAGYLKYQDVSTGQLVAELRTRLGKCDAMAQNPWNAIINLGHSNGTVTMWSPNSSAPLVKMLCHRGPVLSMAVDATGTYIATSGLDGRLKIWDARTYKNLHSYFTPSPASSLAISQKGLLAVGNGPHLTVWKDAFTTKQKEPYMTHLFAGSQVHDFSFCPFEDIIGCGHSKGISSLVVPGSGEPNVDTMEANPYQTTKQRQESEVHKLLDKLQPEMISLDPFTVGRVDKNAAQVEQPGQQDEKFVPVNKKRGKSSAMRKYVRKQTVFQDNKRKEMADKKQQNEGNEHSQHNQQAQQETRHEIPKTALDRFKVRT